MLPSVIVIDDGSGDQTAELAGAAGAVVLRHDRPKGKGAALREGWRHAAQCGFLWAISMDGDGQHAAMDVPKFLRAAEAGPARLISGNRMHATARMPLIRRLTNRFMSWQLSRLAGVRLPDSQCGFRLMHLPSWSELKICTDCFEIESEVLLKFARAGLLMEFVPIQVIYASERSKIRPIHDACRWWYWLQAMRRDNCGSANPCEKSRE